MIDTEYYALNKIMSSLWPRAKNSIISIYESNSADTSETQNEKLI